VFCAGTGEPVEMSADSVSLKKLLQKGDYSDIWRGILQPLPTWSACSLYLTRAIP